MNEADYFKKLCRICFGDDTNLISVFDQTDLHSLTLSYSEMLQECASIDVDITNTLSSLICLNCSKKLESSYKFRTQCITSNNILKQCLDKNQTKVKLEEHNNEEDNYETEMVCDLIKVEMIEDDEDAKNWAKTIKKETNNKYHCNICNKEFKKRSVYYFHRKKHNNDQINDKTTYVCVICDEVFSTRLALKTHSHTHDKNTCKQCFRPCIDEDDLSEHCKTHNNDTEFPCFKCGKVFEKRQTLQRHLRIHSTKCHLCNICGASFVELGNYNAHVRIHTGEKPYKCFYCDAAFSQYNARRSHMITHRDERTYVCELCDKAYKRNNGLKLHVRLEHGPGEEVPCSFCGKIFRDKVHQKRHEKEVHSGIKKHQCSVCFKAFHKRYTLKMHERIHTGEKPFVCFTCGRGFAQKHVLNSHFETHHSN